jgi:uncharacterized membrane protein
MNKEKLRSHWQQDVYVTWYVIIYKLALGLVEFTSGLALAVFGHRALIWYGVVLSRELSEDPHDLLAGLSMKVVPSLLSHNNYLVLYLLILGSAKIAGAVGLIYHRNWGVDLLVSLTALMFPFQLVDLVRHPSLVKFLYILAGLLIALYLIDFRPRRWATDLSDFFLESGKSRE